MEESLKSVRFSHSVLLTMLAAVLLFALSPDQRQAYDRAYAFLDRLSGVKWSAYESWAETTADQHVYTRHDFMKALFEDVRKEGGPVINWQGVSSGKMSGLLMIGQKGPSIDDGSLEVINREFRDDIPVEDLFLPVEKMSKIVRDKLDAQKAYRLDRLVVGGTAGISRLDLQLDFYDENGKLEQVSEMTDFSSQPMQGQSLRSWLTANKLDDLVSKPDDQGVAFEPLRAVWPFISHKTISEAKDWLQQQMLQTGQAHVLTVLGFSVAEVQAATIAPALTFAMLFMLAMYARHARQIAITDTSEVMRTFPWIGLFPGLPGIASRTVTTLVLPVLANAWLLIRAQGVVEQVGWLECAIVLPTAIWTWWEVRLLAIRRMELVL